MAVIIGWYAVLSIGVYGGWWQGKKTLAVLRITPIPVAVVGWRPLSYGDFLSQRQAVLHTIDYARKTNGPGTPNVTTTEAGAIVLTKMVRLAENQQVLRDVHITVNEAGINQAFQAQLLQNGNADQVTTAIAAQYGWTPDEFKRYVIRSSVMQDKLQEKLSFDERLSAAAKTQAEKVRGLLTTDPSSFTALAKQYSQDTYGHNGGDAGFVNQGELIKEIDDAAFNLPVNTISDLIHTKFGYHILEPIERKAVDGQEQVHLLQITILAPTADQYITAHLKNVRVWILTGGLRWDQGGANVTKK